MKQAEILEQVERVIEKGPYSADWDSLCRHRTPTWYEDAKFGIFIHWGVYSVPAYGNEWYPRQMYIRGTDEYRHHLQVYGSHEQFGYKDFIPLFKAEKFDPGAWMDLFEEAGARYVMPVAEHHDGFQMYASQLSRWNSTQMGPMRDVIGELKAEADKRKIAFCVSDHRAEHCWFFNGGLDIPSDIRSLPEFYDAPIAFADDERNLHDIYAPVPPKEHLDNWLARLCELVDNYQPVIVWFDWWIQNIAFRPYLKKFAAYYYNRAVEWGREVAINYKYASYMNGSAVYDVERGQLAGIHPTLWQTDTAIAKNSWGYTENNAFKDPADLVCDLIDIVSKNGCLLLNVGPRADGTITEEERDILLAIGRWLRTNWEGIYGTRPWVRYGEGPTQVDEGAFSDTARGAYTAEDIRYTARPGRIYAFCMNPAKDGVIRLKSLARCYGNGPDWHVTRVALLGGDVVDWKRDEQCMTVRCGQRWIEGYPLCLRIEID